ncbi:MAG: hypothetical protein ABIM46_06710 [candidate division WOR-3 bacterium]
MRKILVPLALAGCVTIQEGQYLTGMGVAQGFAGIDPSSPDTVSSYAYYAKGPSFWVMDKKTKVGFGVAGASISDLPHGDYYIYALPCELFYAPLPEWDLGWLTLNKTRFYISATPFFLAGDKPPNMLVAMGLHAPILWPFALDACFIENQRGDLSPCFGGGLDLTLCYDGAIKPDRGSEGRARWVSILAIGGALLAGGIGYYIFLKE